MNIKKLCVLSLISSICLTGCANNQQSNVNKQIEQKISELKKEKKEFKNEEDRSKRLDILKKIVDNQEKYSKNDESKKVYKNYLKEMRQYFTDDYDKRLSDSKINDLDSMTDIDNINEKKKSLKTLRENLDNEYEYTLNSNKQYKAYSDKVEEMIIKYDERIATINKSNEEQKLAEMAEQKAAQRTYSNDFFTITVPEEWGTNWSIEEDTSRTTVIDGITYLHVYNCSYMPDTNYPAGGGAQIFVLNMSVHDETHRTSFYTDVMPELNYSTLEYLDYVGETSGEWHVWFMNVAASFLDDGKENTTPLATITLK